MPGQQDEEDRGAPMELDAASTLGLLQRARAGDEQARERLYARCLPPLQRWATGRLPRWARDALDTDDLVQQTVIGSLERLAQFEPEHSGAFHAYLRAGILNRIRDALRRLVRRPRRDGTAGGLADPGPSPVEEVIGQEAMAAYERGLMRLKPIEREAVVARVELRLAYAEVAQAIGKPSPDAARMTVSRALVRLAREMALERR